MKRNKNKIFNLIDYSIKQLILLICLLTYIISGVYASDNSKSNPIIKVMYFHGTTRCKECLAIESFSERSLNEKYSQEIKSGRVSWETINFLDSTNEHFQTDYKFETQTLIVARFIDGKQIEWKNLENVWDYLGDYSKFKKYIIDEIELYRKTN